MCYLSAKVYPLQAGPNQISLPSKKQSVITNNNYNSSRLKVLSINCRSIRSVDRRARFHVLIQGHHPDFIIECESQIDQSYSSSEAFPTGYHIFHKDHHEGGDGVFICVKDQFSVSEVHCS